MDSLGQQAPPHQMEFGGEMINTLPGMPRYLLHARSGGGPSQAGSSHMGNGRMHRSQETAGRFRFSYPRQDSGARCHLLAAESREGAHSELQEASWESCITRLRWREMGLGWGWRGRDAGREGQNAGDTDHSGSRSGSFIADMQEESPCSTKICLYTNFFVTFSVSLQ